MDTPVVEVVTCLLHFCKNKQRRSIEEEREQWCCSVMNQEKENQTTSARLFALPEAVPLRL
jgi:hypothetical protein